MSFGLHEAVEYTLAIVLFACVAHTNGATELFCAALAGALALLNLLSARPLGLRRVSYRLHHGMDLLLGVGCVFAAIVWHHDLRLSGVFIASLCAVVLIAFERATRYAPRVLKMSELAPLIDAVGPLSRRIRDDSARALGRATGRGKRRFTDFMHDGEPKPR